MSEPRTTDRDEPCPCGSLAARRLHDGSIECVRCGRVTADAFIAAKRSLEAADA